MTVKQRYTLNYSLLFLFLVFVCFPFTSLASSHDFEATGWIPYWSVKKGTQDTAKHLDVVTEIHPFVYIVKSDGTLKDLGNLKQKDWRKLFTKARSKNVRIVPTVMWSDGVNIQNILSNPELRKKHIDEIVATIKKGKFDGVDIDYEGKKSETKEYFILFLKELKAELDDKLLTCAIEPRTPPESLYRQVPETINYANDLPAIGTYCDRVQIMAYDQRRADIKLNDARRGAPYIPVADNEWVEKVIQYMLKDIPKEKLMLGIPTYGQEYEVIVSPDWFQEYIRVGARNIDAGLKIAKKYKITPTREASGEISFSYIPKNNPYKLEKNIRIPSNTPKGNLVSAQALASANKTGNTYIINYVTLNDAESIESKVDLAKQYDLRGVAIFKFDGETDKKMWGLF